MKRITRRLFLRNSAAAGAAAVAAKTVAVSGMFAGARAANAAPGPKVLVLLRLYGGNDGLNTVIPYTAGSYYDARPTIAVPAVEASPYAIGTGLALHPRMAALHTHFQAGRLAVLQTVGYAPHTLSHFLSEVIWTSGDVQNQTPTGWVGRYLDTLAPAGDPAVRGVDVSWSQDPVFRADHANSFVVPSLDNVWFPTDWRAWYDVDRKRALFDRLQMEPRAAGSTAESLANQGYVVSRNVALYAAVADNVGTTFPDTYLGNALRNVSRMIAARRAGDLAVGVFQVGIGGFDTHADQNAEGGHPDLWGEISTSLDAFHAEMTAQGAADDVLVLVYSEFGRRVEENGSFGTDHGTSAPMFAFGNPVVGGVYGRPEDLDALDDDGNLVYETDFRRVYATVLERFLLADSAQVLGGTFAPVPFLV